MVEADFNAANRSGVAPPEVVVGNNPASGMIVNSGGIKMATSNLGKIYLWDGTYAVYLRLDKTINAGLLTELKQYSMVECTQDAAEFAALLND